MFSKLKNAVKKVWQKAKAVVRVVVRVVVEIVMRVINIFDLLFGFGLWPRKKLRLYIAIVRDPQTGQSVVSAADLASAIQFAKDTFKREVNVDVVPYGPYMVEELKEPAPATVLDVECGAGALGNEFGDEGEFFAKHLAGWNAIPISLTFPITVFVVRDIAGKRGCSLGPLTDYVVIDQNGARDQTTMAHEIGHACLYGPHVDDQSNLMFESFTRGGNLGWWQKNRFRNSRHVTYW